MSSMSHTIILSIPISKLLLLASEIYAKLFQCNRLNVTMYD